MRIPSSYITILLTFIINACKLRSNWGVEAYNIVSYLVQWYAQLVYFCWCCFLRNTESVINSVMLCTFYINFTNFLMSAKPLWIFHNRYLSNGIQNHKIWCFPLESFFFQTKNYEECVNLSRPDSLWWCNK